MDHRIRKVVVLGGGTAGWMTASYLAKALQESVEITVLEAPGIPKIGVGEATVPNLQKVFFDFLGLAEDDWMRECNASFKMGIKFVNWRTGGESHGSPRAFGDSTDHFYHPFGLLPTHEKLPLSQYWVHNRHHGATSEPFAYACYREPPVLDANLAPRRLDGERWTNYAWHFDANLVADFLCRFATEQQSVKHVRDQMCKVDFDERGFITALRTTGGLTIEGDLFVDCSGFRGLLINQAMREPFMDMGDELLCDRAVATSIPHDDERYGVEPYTSAIAMKCGWTWKIPMPGRFGTGYVYSSRFATPDQATEEFCNLWDLDADNVVLNQVAFRVGRNRRAWVKNCVSIGLSSCFLEPLESTGIYFITASIYQLARHFPDLRFQPILTDRFNKEIEIMFDESKDFIQTHFVLAPRSDTPFWAANKQLHLGERIRLKIDMYRAGMAVNAPITDESTYYSNFDAEFRNFWTNSSYYCIFAGLGFLPEHPLPALEHRPGAVRNAEALFASIKEAQAELISSLPTTHEYLCSLHAK